MVLANSSGTDPAERTEQPNDECWVLDADSCLVDSYLSDDPHNRGLDPIVQRASL